MLLITSGDLLIESREVLDCISSLSSKLFDEFINGEYGEYGDVAIGLPEGLPKGTPR